MALARHQEGAVHSLSGSVGESLDAAFFGARRPPFFFLPVLQKQQNASWGHGVFFPTEGCAAWLWGEFFVQVSGRF